MPLNRESLTLDSLRPVIWLAILIWVIEVLNWVSGHAFNQWFGIEPRQWGGLLGVPLSPFLHANFTHVIANTVPLLVLGGMAAMVGPKRFFEASFIIIFLGGFLVWLLARGGNYVHVGASGLVFGYLGYLVALGIFERSFKAILFAAAAAMLYGGLVWGMMPTEQRVSWESHLFGALAGVFAAYVLRLDKTRAPHV